MGSGSTGTELILRFDETVVKRGVRLAICLLRDDSRADCVHAQTEILKNLSVLEKTSLPDTLPFPGLRVFHLRGVLKNSRKMYEIYPSR